MALSDESTGQSFCFVARLGAIVVLRKRHKQSNLGGRFEAGEHGNQQSDVSGCFFERGETNKQERRHLVDPAD